MNKQVINVSIWCDRCKMYTKDNWELHEDRHDDMFYQMGLTNETLKQSLSRLTILKQPYCKDNKHSFKSHWDGSDTLFMACSNCPAQYDYATDPAGDFSGASYDEWDGR